MPVKSLRYAATWRVVTYMDCRVGLKQGSKYGVTYNVTEPHKGHGGGQMKMYFCNIPQKLCEIQKFLIYIHALPGQYGVLENNHSDGRRKTYFEFGLNCDVIKSELYLRERHLKRVLTVRENTRGKAYPDLVALVTFISNHLQCSGQLHGY